MPKPIVLDPKILEDLLDHQRAVHQNVSTRFLDLMLDQVFCEDAVEFMATIPDESVEWVFADEPYGVEGSVIAFRGERKPYVTAFEFDNPLPSHLVIPWVLEAARIIKPGGGIINCGIESWGTSYQNVVEYAGLEMRKQGVWIKTNPPTRVRHGGFKSAHERIWIASKGSLKNTMRKVPQAYLNNWLIEATCPECDTRFPVTWSWNYNLTDGDWYQKWLGEDDVFIEPYKAHTDRIGHVNEKPDWLAAFYLDMLTKEGDVVVDPFAGSGAIPIMAKKMGRHFIANDYDPKWAKVIKDRAESLQIKLY